MKCRWKLVALVVVAFILIRFKIFMLFVTLTICLAFSIKYFILRLTFSLVIHFLYESVGAIEFIFTLSLSVLRSILMPCLSLYCNANIENHNRISDKCSDNGDIILYDFNKSLANRCYVCACGYVCICHNSHMLDRFSLN